METSDSFAVLMMGYGSPTDLSELRGYLEGIVHSRKVSDEMVEDFERRYRAIGGRSPMNEILGRQRVGLEASLKKRGYDSKVYIGTKHWKPSMEDALSKIRDDGFETVIALPLSPYDSYWIMSSYERGLAEASNNVGFSMGFRWVRGWHRNPSFVKFWAESVSEADGGNHLPVIFTAHSLPSKMLEYNDKYPEILRETSSIIASEVQPRYWEFSYQSAGDESDRWLKPDVKTKLSEFKSKGYTSVVVACIGFVFDHLEVLYDLDVLAAEHAEKIGVEMHRARQPNDHPLFIDALASEVASAV